MSLYTDFWDMLYRLWHPTRNSVHSKAHFVIDKGYDILILSFFVGDVGEKVFLPGRRTSQ